MDELVLSYDEESQKWKATYKDLLGPLGEPVYDKDRDMAAFRLGLIKGRNPEKFARTLAEYFAI